MGHIFILLRHGEARGVLFACIIGLIGLTTIDAWAVVNRIDMANADARAMVGAEVEIAFTDGATERTTIREDGSFSTSKPVTERNVKNCFVVRKTPTGEEKRELPSCAWLWGSGGAAAAGPGPGSVMGGLLGATQIGIGGSYSTGLGTTSGSSQSNFANTSGEGNHLHGAGLNVLLRSFIPSFQPAGISLGGFFEFDQFFGVDGTSGWEVHHLNPAVNDTHAIRTLRRAFGFGVTEVIPIAAGFWLGLQQGFAVVQQRVEGVTDQSSGGGPIERFRNDFTHISPKVGASLEYQPSYMPFRIRIASEFIYLPTAGVTGFANFSGSPFHFSSESQWVAITSAGIVVTVDSVSSLFDSVSSRSFPRF